MSGYRPRSPLETECFHWQIQHCAISLGKLKLSIATDTVHLILCLITIEIHFFSNMMVRSSSRTSWANAKGWDSPANKLWSTNSSSCWKSWWCSPRSTSRRSSSPTWPNAESNTLGKSWRNSWGGWREGWMIPTCWASTSFTTCSSLSGKFRCFFCQYVDW